MTLITVAALRAQFNIDETIGDPMLEHAVASGSLVVSKYVGAAAYADAGNPIEGGSGTIPVLEGVPIVYTTDPVRKAMLEAGELRAAMYYLILAVGAGLRRGGLVKTEQDAAGPLNGTVLNSYLNPKELRELREQYLEEALSFLAPYFDPITGVNVLDQAGIGVGTMISTDLEPDMWPRPMPTDADFYRY